MSEERGAGKARCSILLPRFARQNFEDNSLMISINQVLLMSPSRKEINYWPSCYFLLCSTCSVILTRASLSGDGDNLFMCFTASLAYWLANVYERAIPSLCKKYIYFLFNIQHVSPRICRLRVVLLSLRPSRVA